MAVSDSGQFPLVHSLATLLRNDGMFQYDSQIYTLPQRQLNTKSVRVTKMSCQVYLGCNVTSAWAQFDQNNSRVLCASGCSH